MNLRSGFGVLAMVGIAGLSGCGGGLGTINFSGFDSNLTFATVDVTPKPISLAAGATQTFKAATTNAGTNLVQWSSGGVGTFSGASLDTITYTAPATPPIYPATTLEAPQGTVLIYASVQPASGIEFGGSQTVPIIITGTVSVGLSPATANVGLGKPEQFSGYSAGSVNENLTWQVNGVTGGSTAYGTITESGNGILGGYYTAPATMPMTGPTVTITAVAQADPTKTATATVTLQ